MSININNIYIKFTTECILSAGKKASIQENMQCSLLFEDNHFRRLDNIAIMSLSQFVCGGMYVFVYHKIPTTTTYKL